MVQVKSTWGVPRAGGVFGASGAPGYSNRCGPAGGVPCKERGWQAVHGRQKSTCKVKPTRPPNALRVSILLWVARSHIFFCFDFFLVFAIGPGEKELFLYWPASRYAGGATVFKVVAGSTG
jgi:hypothetical protein